MAMLEGPASLRWLLNPMSATDASSRPPFRAESRWEDDASKRSSSDCYGLDADCRQPFEPRDDNSCVREIPTAASNSLIYPESVSQSHKRRFHDRDCRLPDEPKPEFYRNKTAMRAPPKPKLQRGEFISVYSTPLQRKEIDTYGEDGILQCPYTGCPHSFEISTQYDEMKAHYAQHANRKAELEMQSRHNSHFELENVNGSCFSFAPRKYIAHQGGVQLQCAPKSQPSPRHKTIPDAQPAYTKRRRLSFVAQEVARDSQCSVARTIYDVTHPSRALPLKMKLMPETHRPSRTIYDVEHPTAKRSERLAGKKDVDARKGR